MAKPPEYAEYLRLAVEQEELAEDAERLGEDAAYIATHLRQAMLYRSQAQVSTSMISKNRTARFRAAAYGYLTEHVAI
jgi:hypothetical protein